MHFGKVLVSYVDGDGVSQFVSLWFGSVACILCFISRFFLVFLSGLFYVWGIVVFRFCGFVLIVLSRALVRLAVSGYMRAPT